MCLSLVCSMRRSGRLLCFLAGTYIGGRIAMRGMRVRCACWYPAHLADRCSEPLLCGGICRGAPCAWCHMLPPLCLRGFCRHAKTAASKLPSIDDGNWPPSASVDLSDRQLIKKSPFQLIQAFRRLAHPLPVRCGRSSAWGTFWICRLPWGPRLRWVHQIPIPPSPST